MARTRYDACVAQIKADLRQDRGREVSDTRIGQMLTVAVNWFMDTNPNRWPWSLVQAQSIAANETLSIQTDEAALGATFSIEPALNGIYSVRTQVGGTTGDWKDLIHQPWITAIRSPWYNRDATTTLNQQYWSIKVTATAGKTPAYTLETFPYSYATNILYYQIDYRRKTPVVAAGENADDAFMWDDQAWDYAVLYLAEALLAHEIGNRDLVAEAWGFARELTRNILRGSGVEEHRIKLPPPFIMREAETTGGP